MSSRPVLHIIVPCYNPDDGWEKNLVSKFTEFKNALPGTNVLLTVVNDGSTAGVDAEKVLYLKEHITGITWLHEDINRGKGYALRKGVETAHGDFYIYTDIDFPYTVTSIAAIYKKLADGADVVVGIRETDYYEKVPVRRVVISKAVKKLIKYLLRTKITDTQCGLKGFNEKGKAVFLQTTINRFLFDMQFVQFASRKSTLTVEPQVVHTREGISFSHMNYKVLLGESFNFLKLIILPKKRS